MAGLALFGVAVALLVRSGLGMGPWDAFHLGVTNVTGLSVGMASVAVGILAMIVALVIGVKPGLATLLNMVFVGLFIDVMMPLVPEAPSVWVSGVYYLTGIALCGVATGLYIGARLGKGPRDGLMMGISHRTGWQIKRVRTLMEMTVLAAGWLMGGAVGIGTLLFAFLIGPASQWGLSLVGLDGQDHASNTHRPGPPHLAPLTTELRQAA